MVIATTFLTRFIYSSVNYIFAIVLFSQLSVYKCKKKFAILALFLTAVASGAIFAGFCEIPGLTLVSEVFIWFGASLPIFAVQILLSVDKVIRDCVLLLTQANVVMFTVTMMYYLSIHIFNHDFESSLFYSVLTYSVLALSYHFIFRSFYKRIVQKTNPSRRIWNFIFAIPCVFIALQMIFFFIADFRESKYYCLVIAVVAITMLLHYVVMFYSFRQFEEKHKIAEQNVYLSAQSTMWLKQLEQNEKTTENTKQMRHDLRHHDAFLATLLEGQKYDEARAYLSEHMRVVDALQPVIYCQHRGINGILQSIVDSAKTYDVFAKVDAVIHEDFSADLVDMCGLFFNLAENAINECKKLPVQKRFLKINVTCEDNRLAVSLVNPCEGEVELYKGHPVRKGDHDGGVGTRSVMGIVEKYNGVINYNYLDGEFTVDAVIFGKQND